MYKDLINKHLTNSLLNEESHSSESKTKGVQKKEKDFNKEYYKDVEKKMGEYDDAAKQEDEDKIEPPKTNIEGDTEEYHDEMEIRNGQEMVKYDNEPSDKFKERADMALKGDSKMGNETKEGKWNPETGEGNGNTEEVWASSGGKHTGEEIVKSAKASAKKRNDAEYNLTQFGDDIENSGTDKTRGKARKIAVENKVNNKKPLNEKKMKRLRFKKPFDGVGNALQLIPESYREDQKEFEMTDGNESYSIRWEGSLQEGKAVVLKAADANMVNEDMQKMKHLMGFNSKETLGNLNGKERIDEANNNPFRNMLDKTRSLMTESTEAVEEAEDVNEEETVDEAENIEGQTAPKGDWDGAKGPKGDNHADHVMEKDDKDGATTDLSPEQSKEMDKDNDGDIDKKDLKMLRNESGEKKNLSEAINQLMEETGLSEEEVMEGLGSFFKGPSGEEQAEMKQELSSKIESLSNTAREKGWKDVGFLFNKKKLGSAEELMDIAAKNKFRGKIVPRPDKRNGVLYIEYQKGLTNLQKMAGGSGSMTTGQ
jgi:hypothetical protein